MPRRGSPHQNSIVSKGDFNFSNPFAVMCVYISVVLELLCPSKAWIYRKSTPFSSRCVAKECLKVCSDAFFFIPELHNARSNILRKLVTLYCFPVFSLEKVIFGAVFLIILS